MSCARRTFALVELAERLHILICAPLSGDDEPAVQAIVLFKIRSLDLQSANEAIIKYLFICIPRIRGKQRKKACKKKLELH